MIMRIDTSFRILGYPGLAGRGESLHGLRDTENSLR
jgi:hypothetical protein